MTDQIPTETAVRALRAFYPTTSVEWFDGTHIERMQAALAAAGTPEVERLRLELDEAHRDTERARGIAVTLEQENAHLLEILDTATTTWHCCNQSGYLVNYADEATARAHTELSGCQLVRQDSVFTFLDDALAEATK